MRSAKNNSINEDMAKESIQIITSLIKENELSIQKREKAQDKLKVELDELEKALSALELSTIDKNNSLFSPYENSYPMKETSDLEKRISDIHTQIKDYEQSIQKDIEKKEKFEIVLDCLSEFKQFKSEENDPRKEIYGKGEALAGECIIKTQELERQRIARDLHDSTVQNLTNLVHKTELSLKLFDVDPIRTRLELATMIDTIKATINDMRNTIYNLRPMSIEDLGLIPTVEKYIKHFMLENGIQVKLNTNINDNTILPVINLTLYRIIQEACNNIGKYAKASKCIISLNCKDNQIDLLIYDNGIGFDLNQIKESTTNDNNGFGLSIMKERALLLNGTFEIKSKKNKGTQIHVIVPYCDNKGD